MFTLTLFIIAQMYKLPKCPKKWWVDKYGDVYLYDEILFSNKDEVLIHATMWTWTLKTLCWKKPVTKSHLL